jgi:exodeoxyribonuclease VII large subunit
MSISKKKNQYKSISQISQEIFIFSQPYCKKKLFIKGEVTNYRNPSYNGHLYFGLRDKDNKISCLAKFPTRRFFPRIKNGDIIEITCNLSHYEKENTFSLLIQSMAICEKEESDFHIQFKKLKLKYEKLGYFDNDKKKKLKKNNKRIGIITAMEGAAIRDIISVIKRRSYGNTIIIRDTKVQGTDCDGDIKYAIADLNRYKKLDLIIITRGGGSDEALWGFNSEKVIEAVFNSKIPIISAIGHQRDTTLCDFVADKIAPTPTAAAEIITQDKEKIRNNLEQLSKKLNHIKNQVIKEVVNNINGYRNNRCLQNPVNEIRQENISNNNSLKQIIDLKIQMERHKLKSSDISRFSTIFYENKEITSVKEAKKLEGEISTLIFEDGSIDVKLSNITDSSIIVDKKKKKKKQQKKLELLQEELSEIENILTENDYQNMSIKKIYKTKNKIHKLQKIYIYDIKFLKLYENICNELNFADNLIEEINYFKPTLKNMEINEKIYYDSLDKLESISNYKSSFLLKKITYYKKALKYLLIVKNYLEKLKKKFVNIERKVLDNNVQNLQNINEMSLIIEDMFNDVFHNNKRIDEEFFENYYEIKCNLSKHQNEIKNSPIKVIELFNNNGKFVTKDISTSFL